MHNRINCFFVIAFIFLAIQAMGCGQTEYTGFIKDKYQACQRSDGIEYHPEEDQCYCSNGIVCQNGYVCDTDINSCMQYISNITKDECEGEFSYEFSFGSNNSVVLQGNCSLTDNNNIPDCDGATEDECLAEIGDGVDPTPPGDPSDDDPGEAEAPEAPENQQIDDGSTSDHKDQNNLSCPPKGETQCKEGTLSWCSNNNIPQPLACPTDCEDAYNCKTITKSDLTNIPCKNDNTHAKDICIINDKIAQQYQCVNGEWIYSTDCPSGCDIAMHLCRCDPDSYKDSKGLRVCDKEHHIIVNKQ